jgi:hypothetical protein
MRIDAASARTLQEVIRNDLMALAHHTQALTALDPAADPNTAAAVGYHLHNLYNALENTFDQISRSFENHVKDFSRWHQELLGKMFLDISPVRPAVLPRETHSLLHELRGFRHFFRHSYGLELDPVRLQRLGARWVAEGPGVNGALQRFIDALQAAVDTGGNRG